MVKFNEMYGAFVFFGGFLLFLFSLLLFIISGSLHCVPGWAFDYWRATYGLFIASGLAAILAGRSLMDDDPSFMTLAALLSIVSIVPIYGIQLSLNEAASNIDIAGDLLIAIIFITVLFQIYPFYRGISNISNGKQWIIFAFIAVMLVVLGVAIWPISFDCYLDSPLGGGSIQETIFTFRYTSICYFVISGMIFGHIHKKMKKSKKNYIKYLKSRQHPKHE
jgi:hypothetical protein